MNGEFAALVTAKCCGSASFASNDGGHPSRKVEARHEPNFPPLAQLAHAARPLAGGSPSAALYQGHQYVGRSAALRRSGRMSSDGAERWKLDTNQSLLLFALLAHAARPLAGGSPSVAPNQEITTRVFRGAHANWTNERKYSVVRSVREITITSSMQHRA